ncbi:O-antigen ligase family protein [Alphaproteobacteria bacterium]|nr:O-antigen ligase family protein [Alphaproteobacteria bacterium]
MLVLSGICALLALTSSHRFVDTVFLKRNALSIATVGLLVTSALWGISERAAETALRLVLVLAFMLAIPAMFERLDVESQQKWSRYLASSMALGIVCVLFIGPYNLYLPALEDWLSPYLELVRQVNAALTILPVFLFLLLAQIKTARPFWHYGGMCLILGIALVVTAVSNSQTSLLSMLLGLSALGLASLSIRLCRNIIFVAILAATLLAPFVFTAAYEQKWIERFTPSLIQQQASGQTRSFIYYVFSQESLKRPVFGHGINASKYFVPETLDDYVRLTHDRPKAAKAVRKWQKNGRFASHAHNIFLQIIFEVGYLGALLVLATIWQFLRRLEAHTVAIQGAPLIWGSVGAGLGSLMFGYTIWHSWLMAALAFMVVFARLTRPRP